MTNVTVREVTRTVGETAPGGDFTRDETLWEVGAEIDGVFVPFTSFNQSQVDHAKQRADAEQANQPQQAQSQSASNAPKAAAK